MRRWQNTQTVRSGSKSRLAYWGASTQQMQRNASWKKKSSRSRVAEITPRIPWGKTPKWNCTGCSNRIQTRKTTRRLWGIEWLLLPVCRLKTKPQELPWQTTLLPKVLLLVAKVQVRWLMWERENQKVRQRLKRHQRKVPRRGYIELDANKL